MLCINISNIGDRQLARSLTTAVGDKFEFYLHFASEELLIGYGDISKKHGCDTPYLLMHGHTFSGFISFSSPPHVDQLSNLALINFFNEIGVPTIEIQHGLFQYGINNLDKTLRCGFDANGGGWGIPFEYPAKHVITWAGVDGIGYLKSVYPQKYIENIMEPASVLITTNLNWHIYDEYDRYALVNAILSLAVRYPNEKFIWKPHGAEWVTKFKPLFDMAFLQQLPNVRILTPEEVQFIAAEDLIADCKIGISTVSTTLVDYQMRNKPVLVYSRPPVQHMLNSIKSTTFSGAKDLFKVFENTLANLHAAKVDTGVSPLDVKKLTTRLASIQSKSTRHFNPKTLSYLSYLSTDNKQKESSSKPVIINDISDNVLNDALKYIIKPNANYSIEDILRSIEQRIDIRKSQLEAEIKQEMIRNMHLIKHRIDRNEKQLEVEIKQEIKQNLHLIEDRINILQRSTVSYKIKKILTKLLKK